MLAHHPTPGDLAKRLMDLFLASLALVLLSPVLLSIAVAIKWSDGGPVLYRGGRVGKGGRRFRMCKFRTMVPNADRIGGTSTADDDARITRVGRFLRKYKLDELPQLLNVVVGEMSLVGPRPQVPSAVPRYKKEELKVFDVLPGLTDYGSLRFRNEGEILRGAGDADEAYWRLIHPEKMRLALNYVRTRSIRMDIKLVYLTAAAVLGVPIGNDGEAGYSAVTEQWGSAASPQQFSMAYTRYRFAAQYAQGKRILEVACGSGMGLNYLDRGATLAVGGDYDFENLAQARLHGPLLPWVRLDAQFLPFRKCTFDVIVLFEALYYLRRPQKFLEDCRLILRPGGTVLLCMPNPQREGFNPSPLSVRYWSVGDLRALFLGGGFRASIYGAFKVAGSGLGARVKTKIRKTAVSFGLVPKTMAGKALIKKLLHGRVPIFHGIHDGMTEAAELVPVGDDATARDYINLYVAAQRAE